ncbi:hypothetical protein Mapa_007912 [Marchantia paleacea]|nr:hypothetical protein Mapa_007912 [Marchantia paleacea]
MTTMLYEANDARVIFVDELVWRRQRKMQLWTHKYYQRQPIKFCVNFNSMEHGFYAAVGPGLHSTVECLKL